MKTVVVPGKTISLAVRLKKIKEPVEVKELPPTPEPEPPEPEPECAMPVKLVGLDAYNATWDNNITYNMYAGGGSVSGSVALGLQWDYQEGGAACFADFEWSVDGKAAGGIGSDPPGDATILRVLPGGFTAFLEFASSSGSADYTVTVTAGEFSVSCVIHVVVIK